MEKVEKAMFNKLMLMGEITDIEFNGKMTRINLACGNCTTEYCDTQDVCTYAKGDITSEFNTHDTILIVGHVANEEDSVLVWIMVDQIDKILKAEEAEV